VDDFGQAPENRRHSRPHDTRQAGGHISWSSGAGRPPGWGRLLEKSKERGHPARDQNPSRASCPILFTWHQIQRTCYGPEGHSQGKSPCVSICNVARASRSCPGRRGRKSRGISSIFARKQPYWASRLSGRRKIHPESASPIPALPVLRIPPGGGRDAPDGGVKSRWRIEPPSGWKRGRTTGVLARRAGGRSIPKAPPPSWHSRASCPSGWWAERAGRWSQKPMEDRTPDRLEARSYDGRPCPSAYLPAAGRLPSGSDARPPPGPPRGQRPRDWRARDGT
jgi:hypothetical protein